ncbi:MAG: hypothetical protein CVU69_01735 [Deltaproteobacteria bacterium HGW-Deltaproteobacteria-4]|nr:MAG: hypothetical protein CVU69_01735 [Deltaproteobacteria bacterium HGW-Deltaproteobacteria-4]
MRQSSMKIIILLQVFFYLLGGNATTNGLAWCLSADGHAHVVISADCVTEPKVQGELSCTTTAHTGVECRHFPITSPHASSVASAEKVESDKVVTIKPPGFDTTLRCLAASVYLQTPFPAFVELPRAVALDALRSIVLVI